MKKNRITERNDVSSLKERRARKKRENDRGGLSAASGWGG